MFGVESPSTRLTLSVVGISIGTLIAVGGEVQLNVFGLVIHEVGTRQSCPDFRLKRPGPPVSNLPLVTLFTP